MCGADERAIPLLGFEEMELYIRLLKLGFRVLRTSGRAYHLGHPDGGNSSSEHPHFLDNRREYHKVLSLNPADLRQYVSTWPWAATTRDQGKSPATAPMLSQL